MATKTVDLLTEIHADGTDLVLEADDLVSEHALTTAVLLSVFSDARAEDEDELPEHGDPYGAPGSGGVAEIPSAGFPDRRGWWGDPPGDRFGSRLWLLGRAKVTPTTAVQARAFVEEALQWLVDDRIAARVDVDTEFDGDRLLIEVRLHRGLSPRWAHVWAGLEPQVATAPGVRLRILAA